MNTDRNLLQQHIGVLVEQRYLPQAQPAGLCAALQARGHHVSLIDPQSAIYTVGDDTWLNGLDLIVARGRSWALRCLLGWAEMRGIPTINRRSAIAAVHNKAEMAVVLAVANVPTPPTFLGSPTRLATQISAASYPLILKPVFGDNCCGLRVVHKPAELTLLEWPEPVALAQSYLPTDGYDLKLYGIGDELWAVRKPSLLQESAATAVGEAVECLTLTPALRELGHSCRDLFGLDLYGVDCILTPDGPFVIEVNDYPNYTAVPDANAQLADFSVSKNVIGFTHS